MTKKKRKQTAAKYIKILNKVSVAVSAAAVTLAMVQKMINQKKPKRS